MTILELAHSTDGHTVAIIDDPKDGSTKLVILTKEGDQSVVLDFDSLVSTETLEISGPSQAERITKELRALIGKEAE